MNQTLNIEVDNCKLEVDIKQVDSTTLKVYYNFLNQNQQNAYLFNRIYDDITDDDVYTTDRNLMYVEIEKGNVILSKKIIPVPAGTLVEKPIIPCVSKVKTGFGFKETILVKLPLKPWTPYFMPLDEDLAEAPVEGQVFLEFSFFLAPPEGDKLAQTVETSDGTALYFYPFSVSSQKLMRVGPLSWTIPVLMPK